ncbi:ABC transporter substrate-binding protein [Qingshengfaniella alkalisoli]|uniref:ABC transporter substrate-binding protein n=1 Tax=Qingshengfaniella alkalisoli TaxID=2599296 RepID=A0A5B8IXH0_9RHOB|nr:ABC transporter substrate-binding protein [Qingshengfaniella alkalisoli]QDY70852.1 ABC transporter substrate-binding protein [Qingshengfaniella alkalisoli]
MNAMKLAATAALLGSTMVASGASAADAVTFQLDWLPGGDKAPIYVCIDQGFCEQAGLDVTINGGRGSSEAVTKLATGVSDIGIADIGALMAARATENVPVTAVMSVFNKGPHAFYSLDGNGIETAEDVAGKEIATSPFTSSNVFLPLVLGEVGLSEDDIALTKADPGALGPMLMTGAVDGIIAWMTDVSRYTGQAEEVGKEIVVIPWSDAGLELYSASMIASDSFLAEKPDVARRFVEAYKKSIEFSIENPAEAAQSVANMVPELNAENVEGSLRDTLVLIDNEVTERDGLGVLLPERLAATWARVAEAQGLDASALDPETMVDRSFLPGTM